jgi:predicted glutamine amidotransferase
MCRLFGLHAGRRATTATFWLLDAPDNLAAQSRRNPDGTGLGVFGPDGHPVVSKQPMAAWKDCEFATEAHELTGTTFIAHIRYATTGGLDVLNTHPFLQDGRIFAHNGVVEGLDALDARIRDLGTADLVAGQSDSERVFALITGYARTRGGDVAAGLRDAVEWLAGNVPVFALNVMLCTATDLWALRYPEPNPLYVLDRRLPAEHRRFEMRTNRIHTRCDQLAASPSVVFATERMDDDPAWSPLAPGELVHVDADLRIDRRILFPDPPAHQLSIDDLTAKAAAAQQEVTA